MTAAIRTTAVPLVLTEVTLVLGTGDAAVTALDRVDLTVEPGQFTAVIGPSGSGKSSLLAVAGGLIRPTSGTVAVAGVDLVGLSDRARTALRRDQIGYVFQQANLFPALTAREQLMLVAHLAGRNMSAAAARAEELLDAVGVVHRADRRPDQLSGGERQRIGIARALMSAPAVLLVDEPTSALDQHRAQVIAELLAEQTHRVGTATIMVTHDTGILEHADRTYSMRDGQLIES